MQSLDNNTQAFLALVRAGLWEKDVQLASFGQIDFNEVYRLAEEQSVVGLVAAGLEHVNDVKIPQQDALIFVGSALQLETRNNSMNLFIERVISEMRKLGIYTLLVKGQGVAQCYERPLWRASGDVDFLMNEENFLKAREFFRPLVVNGFDPSDDKARNINAQMPPWVIELHNNQYCGLSRKIDTGIEEVQNSIFFEGSVRSWVSNNIQIFLPSADNDVILIFTHLLKHFYKGGLGLRQVCDWSRLLWKYQEDINVPLLENRLISMRLLSEWKAFGTFTVEYLGMSPETIPFYSSSRKWVRKANKIFKFMLEVGNMGHNRDMSYYGNKSFIYRKTKSLTIRLRDLTRHMRIFPLDSLRFTTGVLANGIKMALMRRG